MDLIPGLHVVNQYYTTITLGNEEEPRKRKLLNCLHLKGHWQPDMVIHSCNSSIPEAEAGRYQVPGQIGLYKDTLSRLSKSTNKQTKTKGHWHLCFPERNRNVL
jgi:hypothetical protein